jgi:hypothetical protein
MPSTLGQSFEAYSGNPPYRNVAEATTVATHGPLPEGTYYIVDRPVSRFESMLGALAPKSDWFALYRKDAVIDDETMAARTLRGQFRLHPQGPLGSSEGCVTLTSREAFRVLRKRLLNTQKSNIPGTSIPHYGTITVYRPALY